jgi:hypothetical protein
VRICTGLARVNPITGLFDAPASASHVMQIPLNLLTYDGARRRLWIAGQRCHHGTAGAVLTASAAFGLTAARWNVARALVIATTGSLLMAHDWHDRSMWFQRGWQNQP